MTFVCLDRWVLRSVLGVGLELLSLLLKLLSQPIVPLQVRALLRKVPIIIETCPSALLGADPFADDLVHHLSFLVLWSVGPELVVHLATPRQHRERRLAPGLLSCECLSLTIFDSGLKKNCFRSPVWLV